MKIQILGSGYIGSVNAFCLMNRADIRVFDIDPVKQKKFQTRTPLFFETNFDWDSFYEQVVFRKSNTADAIVVCVDAAFEGDRYDLKSILGVLEEYPNTPVILRSTLGANEIEILSRVQHSCLYYWPEFLREGSAISDFHRDENFLSLITGHENIQLMRSVIGEFTLLNDAKVAASVKLISNYYRALKVSFGNQVGIVLDNRGIDKDEFFDVFFRLRGNCDAMYLRPGPPFGGHCLPKETAMAENLIAQHFERSENLAATVIQVNGAIIRRKADTIRQSGANSVGISQFSFKKGTSDLRNSQTLELAQVLKRNMQVFDLDGSSMGGFPPVPEGTKPEFAFRGHEDW